VAHQGQKKRLEFGPWGGRTLPRVIRFGNDRTIPRLKGDGSRLLGVVSAILILLFGGDRTTPKGHGGGSATPWPAIEVARAPSLFFFFFQFVFKCFKAFIYFFLSFLLFSIFN
jgi:hypothetical protein